MSEKSPAFQWYPKDILASARVQEMTLAEEGGYRRLLDYCWINGDVPADEKRCARLIGKGATPEIARVALDMFIPHPTNPERMIHDRLEAEREKQQKNSEARRLASEARWNKQGTTTDARGKQAKSKSNAIALQMESSSSSTSSSTSPSEKKRYKASPRQPKDPRGDSPAIQACKGLASRYPDKNLWDGLISILGDSPDLTKLQECRVEWLERGYNPTSWKWAMDWYVNGIPDRHAYRKSAPKSNGINAANGSEDEFVAEVQRIHEERNGTTIDMEAVQ